MLADADRCVKCALCLPHCPTYLHSRHEGDSPRGRITLVQGLASGLIEATPRAQAHLDGCLSCRRCEVVCPARVPFSRILDAGRAELARRAPSRTAFTRVMARIFVSPILRGAMRLALRAYQRLGLQRALRRRRWLGGRLAYWESLLPEAVPPARAAVSALAEGAAPRVMLFRGCGSPVFEPEVLDAATRLLQAAGYAVDVPPDQGCCGALHQHGGMPDQARALALANLRAFAGESSIASITTGCAATLRDYADLGVDAQRRFVTRVQDIAELLLARVEHLHFAPLHLRAALHLPCTARNVMQSDTALRALLARIPGLQLVDLDPAQHCCGAAGLHFLAQPDDAARYLQPKLDAVARLAPDVILSSNIGCSLHLGGGLSRSAATGSAASARVPPVRHPVWLLAQQLVPPAPRS